MQLSNTNQQVIDTLVNAYTNWKNSSITSPLSGFPNDLAKALENYNTNQSYETFQAILNSIKPNTPGLTVHAAVNAFYASELVQVLVARKLAEAKAAKKGSAPVATSPMPSLENLLVSESPLAYDKLIHALGQGMYKTLPTSLGRVIHELAECPAPAAVQAAFEDAIRPLLGDKPENINTGLAHEIVLRLGSISLLNIEGKTDITATENRIKLVATQFAELVTASPKLPKTAAFLGLLEAKNPVALALAYRKIERDGLFTTDNARQISAISHSDYPHQLFTLIVGNDKLLGKAPDIIANEELLLGDNLELANALFLYRTTSTKAVFRFIKDHNSPTVTEAGAPSSSTTVENKVLSIAELRDALRAEFCKAEHAAYGQDEEIDAIEAEEIAPPVAVATAQPVAAAAPTASAKSWFSGKLGFWNNQGAPKAASSASASASSSIASEPADEDSAGAAKEPARSPSPSDFI